FQGLEVLARVQQHLTIQQLHKQLLQQTEQLNHEVQERQRLQQELAETKQLFEELALKVFPAR
ncbi:MAG TPA: hypothetical protein V6C65_39005, partial [Allocoleopsis sp.]